MTTKYHDFHPKQRRPASARRLNLESMNEGLKRRIGEGAEASKQPFVGVTANGAAQQGLYALRPTGLSLAPVRAAAEGMLAALGPATREAAGFAVDAAEWRLWCNVHPFLMRHGALLDDMDRTQRDWALSVLRESMSPAGFKLSRDIMRLNALIGDITRPVTGSDDEYGEWMYWVSVMGTPSPEAPWGWQLDGHHLNVNCMIVDGQMVMTPMFMGSEPVAADYGMYAGTRVFEEEEAQGLALMQGLTAPQQAQALLSDDVPGEVFTTAFRDNFELRYEGVRYDTLSSPEQEAILGLIETYVGRMRAEHAQAKMAEVREHLAQTYFAWMGTFGDDGVFYYRIHSPVILIEFDHQHGVALDDPEPTRNHIHTVVRTPNGNDYGMDLLRQHREHGHAHA
jgi:hypothetical protein